MIITRHNYEEFFILYLDNELSPGDRGQVELFIQAHPDLAEELNIFQQAKLIPDTSLVYTDKESLEMASEHSFINQDNYDKWLLLYADNELNAEQKKSVDQFISLNPLAKTDLALLLQTKLQPDPAIVYFNKESLYRKEERERRIIPVKWRLAAAAVLLFAIAGSLFLVFNNRTGVTKPGIAASDLTTGKTSTQAQSVDSPRNKKSNQPLPATDTNNPVTNVITKDNKDQLPANPVKADITVVEKKKSTMELKVEDPIIASTIDNNPNDLPETRYNGHAPRTEAAIAFTDVKALTNQQQIKPFGDVTPTSLVSLDNSVTAEEIEQPGKKNKLRGLFRKITRTLEKTTNIKATDDNDRLLVAGLAIQL